MANATDLTLRLAREPADVGWTLRSSNTRGMTVALIDWTTAVPPVDAGVPAPVADALSAALCEINEVTFLDAHAASRLTPAAALLRPGKPAFRVTTTSRAEVAAGLFDDADFPWVLRSQVVILTPRGTAPELAYEDLFELWSAATPDLGSLASRMAAEAYALPGPDGDFVEIASLERRHQDRLEEALRRACAQADIGFERLRSTTGR